MRILRHNFRCYWLSSQECDKEQYKLIDFLFIDLLNDSIEPLGMLICHSTFYDTLHQSWDRWKFNAKRNKLFSI
jgi:hypothetical protein